MKGNKIEKLLIDRGYDIAKLLNDPTVYKITNLDKAAKLILDAVNAHKHIHVVADYDCDGVMSGAILYLILSFIGADFTIRFPRKMSEGYGISEKIVNEIPNGSLVVTIDNGISAIEAVSLAKTRGMSVVILDHHQIRADKVIPDADCVVDPHIFKEDGEFEDYCGAGIGYMLAKEMKLPQNILDKANVFAAIATVQDVVALVDDNRNIVKNGLRLLNENRVKIPGLYSLCSALKLEPNKDKDLGINEENLAFKIGPCVNAMGRMLDEGASMAFERLVHYDIYGEDGIREMVEWNEKRKELTTQQQNILEIAASSVKMAKTTCLVLYAPGLHEGVIGINAANLVEKYNMPAIVFTDDNEGRLKGSGRSTPDINMKEALDSVSEYIYKHGGHAGAAGITLEKDQLDNFTKNINRVVKKSTYCANSWQYDLEISADEIAETYEEIKKYAPYGEGFKAPIVRINNFKLVKHYGKFYRYIGENGVAFNSEYAEAVSFTMRDKYKTFGSPLDMNIVGTLGYSSYSRTPNVLIIDFQPIIQRNAATGYLL